MSCLISACLWPLLFCIFANITTDRIASIGDSAFNANWIDFPPDLRKYIIMIIMRSNDKVYFTGLGIVRCTLAVFAEVIEAFILIFVVLCRNILLMQLFYFIAADEVIIILLYALQDTCIALTFSTR